MKDDTSFEKRNPVKTHEDVLNYADLMHSKEFKRLCKKYKGTDIVFFNGILASYAEAQIERWYDIDSPHNLRCQFNSLNKLMSLSGLVFLKAAIMAEMAWMVDVARKKSTNQISERDYGNYIEDNFSSIFPNYNFISREAGAKNGTKDKIDFLCMEKKSLTPVIIELKKGRKSGHKQLFSYQKGFPKAIMINVSEEMPATLAKGIIYLTYEDLGFKGVKS